MGDDFIIIMSIVFLSHIRKLNQIPLYNLKYAFIVLRKSRTKFDYISDHKILSKEKVRYPPFWYIQYWYLHKLINS